MVRQRQTAMWLSAVAMRALPTSVTEQRVWHFGWLRSGGFSVPGHEGWHVLGTVAGS
jgi:hypothetical protein